MTEDEIIIAYLTGMMLWHSQLLFPYGEVTNPQYVWRGLYDASNISIGCPPNYAPEGLK